MFIDDIIAEETMLIEKKLKRIKSENKKLKEALQYCANYAHPSIVQDVAKKALGKSFKS